MNVELGTVAVAILRKTANHDIRPLEIERREPGGLVG
jgi:hypothetical protein